MPCSVADIYLETKADKRVLRSEIVPQDLWEMSTGPLAVTAYKTAVFISTTVRP
jgi:hypothetical protein